jgi:hypothetical protein
MPGHDHYEELCALAAGGHLDSTEYVAFQAHVKECGECRTAYREMAALITQDLPQANGALKQKLATVMTKPLRDSRQRFLRRARSEGVVFSREVEAPAPSGSWHFRPATVLAAATVLVAAAVSLTAYHFRSTSLSLPDTARTQDASTAVQQIAELTRSRDQLQALLSDRQKTIESKDGEVNQWRSQAAVQARKIDEMQRDLEQSRRTSESLPATEAALKDSRSRLAELEVQIQAKERQLADATAEAADLRQRQNDSVVSLVDQQTRVNELSEQLRTEKATLDMERQLLAAGRDVREIMGARQLHIVDVHDSDSKGKDRLAFGRIFYSEGKQLVFYAFDLNEARIQNAKHTFQVWGQQEGSTGPARSLGFLISDDKTQKRWALKVSDAQLLKEIDSVFVTLEPAAGGKQPSGQKMLYAYLGDANHP